MKLYPKGSARDALLVQLVMDYWDQSAFRNSKPTREQLVSVIGFVQDKFKAELDQENKLDKLSKFQKSIERNRVKANELAHEITRDSIVDITTGVIYRDVLVHLSSKV